MAAGFEAPAVIVVTRNLEENCNPNYYLRAQANLVIFHIPDEPDYILEPFQNNQPWDKKSPHWAKGMFLKSTLKEQSKPASNESKSESKDNIAT